MDSDPFLKTQLSQKKRKLSSPDPTDCPGSARISQTLTSIKYQGLVCSRFSDSGDDAKVKGTAKILARDLRKGGGGERESRPASPQFPPVLFSRWRCYNDIGIPIPKTIVIWASPSHITLAIWVRVTGDAHTTRVSGVGMPISLWQRFLNFTDTTISEPGVASGDLDHLLPGSYIWHIFLREKSGFNNPER